MHLAPGDHLKLSRPDGAFIVSFGRFVSQSSHLTGWGQENPHSKDFNPFVAVAGRGSAHVAGTTFTKLGFGETPKFSGFSVVSNQLTQSPNASTLVDNLFDRLNSVSVLKTQGAQIIGNRFLDMRYSSLVVSDAPSSRIWGNLIAGNSPTNAIRVMTGSKGTVVIGNVLLKGKRVGILVRDNDGSVLVSKNIIWKRNGAAIKFLRSRCGIAAENLALDNRQKGIEVRQSDNTGIFANTIAANHSAGLWISAQNDNATTFVEANALNGNGSGLSTATGAHIYLTKNNFSKQMPRLLDGDSVAQTVHIASDLKGEKPYLLTASAVVTGTKNHQEFCPG